MENTKMIDSINCTIEVRRTGKLNDLIVRGEDGKIITRLSGYQDSEVAELRSILQKVYSKPVETATLDRYSRKDIVS